MIEPRLVAIANKVRKATPGFKSLALTGVIGLCAALIILYALSEDPGEAIFFFFVGPFLNLFSFGNMLNAAVPLALSGLGMLLAFRASTFNLGGEGQIYAGALAATATCLMLPGMPGLAGILTALGVGVLVGAGIGCLSGVLRMKWAVNELLSSFLISAVVVLIVDYLITGPLDDPASNLLATFSIAPRFRLLEILTPSHLNVGFFAAIGSVVLVHILLFYSRTGYELRICGLNREFARYGGIRAGMFLVIPMALSGALHGFAGGISILGTYHRSIKSFSAGIGWNGIAVALIGKNRPAGVFLAALFFAYLEAGAKAAMIHSHISNETAMLVQSIIFFLITAQSLVAWFPRRGIIRHRGATPLLGRGRR